jgi:protease IV
VFRFLKWIFKLFASFVMLFMVLGLVGYCSRPKLPDKGVLLVQLDGNLAEAKGADLSSAFGEPSKLSAPELFATIVRAAHDPKIRGLVLRIGSPLVSPSQVLELEQAMREFRQSGKWNVAHLETTSETPKSDIAYELATCASKIVLGPSGDISLEGLHAQVPFAKDTLDRLRIKPFFEKRAAYKNAPDTFTHSGFTQEHYTAVKALVDDLQQAMVNHIAARRNTQAETVTAWIVGAPYASDVAQQRGMVDQLGYWDNVLDDAKKLVDLPDPFIAPEMYAALSPAVNGPKFALIVGSGNVVRGESIDGPMSDATMGSDTLTQAFRDARKAKVKGVLFRVDSPGGSYVASDLIRREVLLTKKAGIPVVVSMGSVAASGGYFVAMDADAIVAEPTTITGSIGVFSGSFATREFFDHFLGVKFGTYDAIPNTAHLDFLDPPSDKAKARLRETLDRIYHDFVSKAATARHKSYDDLQAIAQGRVWSGTAAQKIGLVDSLGGFATALERLKELAKVKKDAPVVLEIFPAPKNAIEMLRDLLHGGSDNPVFTKLARLNQLLTQPQALSMPEVIIQ